MKHRVLLITGKSVPLPNAAQLAGEGGEIVRTRLKNRDNVNPLVPGSSPGGPTNFSSKDLCRSLGQTINICFYWINYPKRSQGVSLHLTRLTVHLTV
jgi:hypothetical protein